MLGGGRPPALNICCNMFTKGLLLPASALGVDVVFAELEFAPLVVVVEVVAEETFIHVRERCFFDREQ